MERIKQALIAIQAENGRAVEILTSEIERDRVLAIAGIAAFIVAALAGVVIDPENL